LKVLRGEEVGRKSIAVRYEVPQLLWVEFRQELLVADRAVGIEGVLLIQRKFMGGMLGVTFLEE
jgi:hypothetical protein